MTKTQPKAEISSGQEIVKAIAIRKLCMCVCGGARPGGGGERLAVMNQ